MLMHVSGMTKLRLINDRYIGLFTKAIQDIIGQKHMMIARLACTQVVLAFSRFQDSSSPPPSCIYHLLRIPRQDYHYRICLLNSRSKRLVDLFVQAVHLYP